MYADVDDAGVVLVHNDFGPNNTVMGADLADARDDRIAAITSWKEVC